MSPSTRVVVGTDDRGRPKAEWRPDPGQASAGYGFMEPAYDGTTIERRKATPEELAAARAREEEPRHLVAPTNGTPPLIVGRLHPEPEPTPEEPTVISDVSFHDPDYSDPMTETDPVAVTQLERLAVAAGRARMAREEKEAADTAWDVAREALARAYADCEWIVEPLPPQPDDDHAHYVLTVPLDVSEPILDPAGRRAMPNVEELPSPIGGGPAPRRTVREPRSSGLSSRQALAIELMQAGHNRAEVARRMGTTYQTVDGLLEAAAKKKLLPGELIPLLPARFAKYTGAEA